jgi:CBS domain-containing protein
MFNFFPDSRTALAFTITLFSILSITGTSIVYLLNSTDKDRAAERVLSSSLPLYGTWVGTLLAYYFAKENFDSATKSTVALSQLSLPNQFNNLESILVSAAISNRFLFEDDLNRSLRDVKGLLIKNDRKRLPVLNSENRTLQFLAYYEDLDAYSTSNLDKTLGDFIQASLDKNKPVVFVSKDVSLAKANEERKKIADCRDIFVTENGSKDGKVIGYLSDFDIDKYSRA